MNILMVSSYLPYPLYSGGHIRLYNLLKLLSKKHSITLLCEKRENQTEQDEKEIMKFCSKLKTIPRKKQWTLANILKTGFSFYPFLLVGHTNKEMKSAIKKELLNGRYDIIHAETSYIFQNVPKTLIPTVLVEHNIEHLVYKRYADRMSIFIRPLLYIDIFKLKFFEQRFWKLANRLIAVSEKEKKLMGRNNAYVVPNGVNTEKFRIQNSEFRMKEKRILFIGDFKWIQNRDACEWLLKEIWPKLNSEFRIQNSELRLWIVGKNIPSSIKNLKTTRDVIFDENASEKTEEIYQKSFALVAPIRVGGGTQYKILEAMSSGVPVVTTTLGIQGLEGSDRKEVLVADSSDSFVLALIELLEKEKLRNEIIKNARKMVVEKYDWKIIAQKLEDVYKSAISANY